MLRCYISHSDLSNLLKTCPSDEPFSDLIYKDFFKSEDLTIYLLKAPGEKVDESNMFIQIKKRQCRLAILDDPEKGRDSDMYNDESRGVVFDRGREDVLDAKSGQRGIVFVNTDNRKHVFDRIGRLFHKDPIETRMRKGIQSLAGIPVSCIVYQDNFFLNDSSNPATAVHNIFIKFQCIFSAYIESNLSFFYNNTLYVDIIYGKINHSVSVTVQDKIKQNVKIKIADHYKNPGIEVVVSFVKGYKNPHARIMVSEYFFATAGEEFSHPDTQIMAFGVLEQPKTYKLMYERLKEEYGNSRQINVPGIG